MERFIKEKSICFIPARGGSERIKNKNLSEVGNTNLLKKAISTAYMANFFDEIVVSTDSKEIAEVSIAFNSNIKIHSRPPELSHSFSQIEDALHHFLKNIIDCPNHTICLMQCTSPFTTFKDLVEGIKKINTGKFNSVIGGFKIYPFLWEICDENCSLISPKYNYKERPRTQEMKSMFYETGAFYFFKAHNFFKSKKRVIKPVSFIEMSPQLAIHDINTLNDLDLANKFINGYEEF